MGYPTGGSIGFDYGTVTLYGRPFHAGSSTHELCNSLTLRQKGRSGPTTPTWQRLPALPPDRFGLYPVRSPLLGASRLFSLPQGTEMFQFPWFPLPALCVQAGMTWHDPRQVFPFGNPRINACLAASRGLSQPATSFIGFQRLGIHRVPFATCRDDARARYGVLNDHAPDRPAPTRTPTGIRTVRHGPRPPPPFQGADAAKTRSSQPSKLHSVPTRRRRPTPAGHDHLHEADSPPSGHKRQKM